MISRIKKNDTVFVISGKDKGKQGQVIKVIPTQEKVLVKGVCVVTKHAKAKKSGEKSKIVHEERPVPLCVVMPVCSSCKQYCRIRIKLQEDGSRSRVCHKCNESF